MADAVHRFIAFAKELVRALPPFAQSLVLSIATALAIYTILGAIFVFIESRQQRDLTRYRSRHFVNDIAYTLLYQGGIYNILVYAPLFAWAAPKLAFLQLDAVGGLPPVLSILIYWVTVDLAAYWIHRMQHTVGFLWAFHSVHHTQTRMTYLSSNRNHILEQLYVNGIMLAPALILGMPASLWMPVYFIQTFFEHAQHAQLRWTYGPLHRVFVSPAFHLMHHSTKPEEYNGNYSKILSLWDLAFGTFVRGDRQPERYGVDGMDVPEHLVAQFAHPFRVIGGSTRQNVPTSETSATIT
jgi:sterol desaturase/sphingolipid hydroxylase (fatty acid hydroxylase superfamily)